MGVLPTYASVGLLAPALLVLLRLIQGFGAGADYAGAGTMTVEYAVQARRGRGGAVPATGAAVGSLLSSVAFAITTNVMSDEAFLAWGWRVPFLVRIVLVGVGLYVRFQLDETPDFKKAAESGKARVPLVDVLRNKPRSLVLGILASIGPNIGVYLPTVFGISYITQNTGVGRERVTIALILAYGAGIFVSLLAGRLSDQWGAKRVFVTAALFSAALGYPFFGLVGSGEVVVICAAFILAVSFGFYGMTAPQGALLAAAFPARTRYSGIAISREFSAAISGGTTPLIATALLVASGDGTWIVSAYAALMFLVAAGAAAALRPHTEATATGTPAAEEGEPARA